MKNNMTGSSPSTGDLADVALNTGIVWAYRFSPDGTATLVPNGQVDAALAAAGALSYWALRRTRAF